MGEYSSAEILIGGQIRKGQIRALCKAIREQGVSTDWGAAPFQPRTGEDLLAACQKRDEVLLLQLCDDQASGGQFGRLENYLRRAKLPYERFSDSTTVYDGERVDYRPGHELVCVPLNSNGQPVVTVDRINEVAVLLECALRKKLPRNAGPRKLIRTALKRLNEILPPDLPPLPPFEIQAARAGKRGPATLKRLL